LVSALNSVDLPALGSPTIPMVSATGVKGTGRPPARTNQMISQP
jgi:hypothetical protein